MGYPSLLYYKKPNKKPIGINVFEDLQLLNFIPRSVAKNASVPCEKENILCRQSLFKKLWQKDNRARYEELYEISEEIYSLDRAYAEASHECEKNVIFFFLCSSFRAFVEKASEADMSDPISSRFSSAFKDEKNSSSFVKLCSDIDGLEDEAQKLLKAYLNISGDDIKAQRDGEETFFERIISCAKTLGLNTPKVKNTEQKKLSPDIISAIVKLYPEVYSSLISFKKEYGSYYCHSVVYYRKEIRFYLTMLSFLDRIKEADIPLTYPVVSEKRIINVKDAFDVSLLAKNEKNIVPNDILFNDDEPFFFLTGANGGGKTTYLRTVGITVVLFLLGCPVPCKEAEIGDISSVFTHFPRDERFDGSGRFVEENNRVKEILNSMDDNSLVLLNETYSTTNEENAILMTEKLANELHVKNILGLYITHQHSLSNTDIPYLNVIIDLKDENRRTFKIAKQKSVGGSYAKDILEKCKLTLEALERRFGKLENGEEKI